MRMHEPVDRARENMPKFFIALVQSQISLYEMGSGAYRDEK